MSFRNLETIFQGLFGNNFWLGLASCGNIFFFFLASIQSEFLLRDVSIQILVFVNLFLYCDFFGAPWGSLLLAELHLNGMQFYQ